MTLSNELQESIQKNLPTMVGEELKKVLQKAEDDAQTVAVLNLKLEEAVKNIRILEKDNKEQEDICDQLRHLNVRKEVLDNQERNLKLQIAEAKVVNSEAMAKQAFDMVSLVFRNTTVMRTQFTNTPVATSTLGGSSFVKNYTPSETFTEGASNEPPSHKTKSPCQHASD